MKRRDGGIPRSDTVTARVIGRGILVITGAKIWFMLGGAAITFGLPFIFDRYYASGRALYGQYYDLNNILSIFSMVMVTGVMQSVSRYVAPSPKQARDIVRHALRFILIAGTVIGGGLIALSPTIAASRGNPDLVNGYRAAGCIIFAYGIYTVMVGCLNGQKRFVSQALLDILFTGLKVSLVLGMAAAGFGVLGAFTGFAIAAAIIAGCALMWVYPRLNEGETSPGYISYAVKVMLYAFVFNLIFKLDGIFVKPAIHAIFSSPDVSSATHSVGQIWPTDWPIWWTTIVQQRTDESMATYGMALALARLPWQATIAVTFVMFPLMSAASFAKNRAKTQLYIRETLRYSAMIIGLTMSLLVALPESIFAILPHGYASGTRLILVLGPAYFFFSLFNLTNTLLIAGGRAATALTLGVVIVSLIAASYWLYLPSANTSDLALLKACQINFIVFATGFILGLIALWSAYGPPFPLRTAARITVSMLVVTGLGQLLPALGLVTALFAAIGLTVMFILLLFLMGEFDQTDRHRLLAFLGRRK